MKNVSLKIFIVILVLTLICVSVIAVLTKGFTRDIFERFQSEDVPSGDMSSGVTDENGNELDAGVINSLPSQLNISQESLAHALEEGKEYIELTLEAKIIPEDATDQSVDWSLAWADGTDSSDISEYLTVTPTYDGSRIISLKCYQPFDKQIFLTVVTRDGGYSDNCLIKYVGEISYSLGVDLIDCERDSNGVYLVSSKGVQGTINFISTDGYILDNIPSSDYDFEINCSISSSMPHPLFVVAHYGREANYMPGLTMGEDYDVPNIYAKDVISSELSCNLSDLILDLRFKSDPFDSTYMVESKDPSNDNVPVYIVPMTQSNYDNFSSSPFTETWDIFYEDYFGLSAVKVISFNEDLISNPVVTVTVKEKNTNLSASFSFRLVK